MRYNVALEPAAAQGLLSSSTSIAIVRKGVRQRVTRLLEYFLLTFHDRILITRKNAKLLSYLEHTTA